MKRDGKHVEPMPNVFATRMNEWIFASEFTKFSRLFHRLDGFNDDVSGWGTKGVTSMSSTFCCARKFNHDISKWNTSQVKKNFFYAFVYNEQFDGSLSGWEVGSATTMEGMFQGAMSFNQDSFQNWDSKCSLNA